MTLPQHSVTPSDLVTATLHSELDRLSSDELVDAIKLGLTDDAAITRELSANLISEFQDETSGRATDLAQALERTTIMGRGIDYGLAHISEVVRSEPDKFIQVGQELAQAATDGSLQSHPTPQLLICDAIAASSPGAIKPAVPSLVELLLGDNEVRTQQAGWTLVRAASAEPEVIRPFIAERIWELDSANPSAVVDALNALGAVGWVLPEHIPIDRLNTQIETPKICAAKIKAIGKILAQPPVDGDPFGRPTLSSVDQFLDLILDGFLADSLEVRKASIQTCKWISTLRPKLLKPYKETLVTALKTCSDIDLYEDILEIFLTFDCIPRDVYEHVSSILGDTGKNTDKFEDNLTLKYRSRLLQHGAQSNKLSAGLAVLRDVCFKLFDNFDRFTDSPLDEMEVEYIEQLAVVASMDRSGEVWQTKLIEKIRSPEDPREFTAGTAHFVTELSIQEPQKQGPLSEVVNILLFSFGQEKFPPRILCNNLTRIVNQVNPPLRTEIHKQIATYLVAGPFHSEYRHLVAETLAVTAETQPAVIGDAVRYLRTIFRLSSGELGSVNENELDESTVRSSVNALSTLCMEATDAVALVTGCLLDILAMNGHGSGTALDGLIEIGSRPDSRDQDLAEELRYFIGQADHDLHFRLAIAHILFSGTIKGHRDIIHPLLDSALHENGHDKMKLFTRLSSQNKSSISILSPFIHYNIKSFDENIIADLATTSPEFTTLLQRRLEKRASRPGEYIVPQATSAISTFAEEYPEYISEKYISSEAVTIEGVPDKILHTLEILQHTDSGSLELLAECTRHPVPDIRHQAIDILRARRNNTSNFDVEPSIDSSEQKFRTHFRRLFRHEPVESVTTLLTTYVDEERLSRSNGLEILLTELAYSHTESEFDTLALAILELSNQASQSSTEDSITVPAEVLPTNDLSKAVVQCLCDPSRAVKVKTMEVMPLVPRIDDIDLKPVIEEILSQADYMYTARILLASLAGGIAIPPESLAEIINEENYAGLLTLYAYPIVFTELASVEPDAVAENQDALHTLLTTEMPYIQNKAIDATADLSLIGVDLDTKILEEVETGIKNDSVDYEDAANVLRTFGTKELKSPEDVMSEFLSFLSTQPPEVGAVFELGQFLEEIATEQPSLIIESFDDSLSTKLSEGDIDSISAEYTIYRILSILCDYDSAVFEGFAEPIETTLSQTGSYDYLRENTSERGVLTVFEPALREAAASAAAAAGSDVFLTALEEFHTNNRPTHSPPTIATFLLRASPSARSKAITWIEANATQNLRRRIVKETASRIVEDSDSESHRVFLKVAEQLLVKESEPLGNRIGITTVLCALDSPLSEVRQTAINVAQELAILGPLSPEEWLSHVLELLGDEDPGVRQAAAEALPRVLEESTIPVEYGFEICTTDARDGSVDIHRRQGATIAFTELGKKVPTCRNEATKVCINLLEADDRLVRHRALIALGTYAELSPPVVEPYLNQVREHTRTGSTRETELARQVVANYYS